MTQREDQALYRSESWQLTADDIDPDLIREARAVVATGTHLSHPQVEAATLKALNIARQEGMQTALDIDYRPNLWGVAGHDAGVYPDWWKLEPLLTDAAWQHTIDAIERNDANTRGIVVPGLCESEEKLADSFKVAARYPLVKGFAVGRTIFAESAAAWMRGELSDNEAIATMADNYRLSLIWDEARLKGNVHE